MLLDVESATTPTVCGAPASAPVREQLDDRMRGMRAEPRRRRHRPGNPGAGNQRSEADVNRQLTDHTDRLFRAAYALCGTRAGAEDLVEETFARALERPRLPRGSGPAHLMRVLHDASVDFGRAASAGQVTGSARGLGWVADQGGDPGELALHVRLAYAAVTELPPPLRAAVVAVDVAGLCHRDAARALRIGQGTLRSRVFRARERIAAALEGSQARAGDERGTRATS